VSVDSVVLLVPVSVLASVELVVRLLPVLAQSVLVSGDSVSEQVLAAPAALSVPLPAH